MCGHGPSLADAPDDWDAEIVVNDGWKHRPAAQYCVVLDRPGQMSRKGRTEGILCGSGTLFLSSQHCEKWVDAWASKGLKWRNVWWNSQGILIKKSMRPCGSPFWRNGRFSLYATSPFVAVQLAAFMGAATVGLIGVDLLDCPDFDRKTVRLVDQAYGMLLRDGVPLTNLSKVSALKSLPRLA